MNKFSILFILFLFTCNLNGQSDNDYPLIPVNTNFSYWDHHWIMWTPQHPKYEAIEVMVQDNNENPDDRLVRIFFTERSGNKNQVYYFNDIETVNNWKGEAYFRTVDYKAIGEAGHPLNLFIKFLDKDSLWVEWTVNFNNDQLLSSQYSGLKDQGGHAAGTVFLIFYSGDNSTTTNATLLINGEDFSSQTPVSKEGNKKYYVAAYSSGVYTAVISYAQSYYSVIPGGLRSSWGRIFIKSVNLIPGFIYSCSSFGFNNNSKIEIETDELDGIIKYTHWYAGHSFTIHFEPTLNSVKLLPDSTCISYNISLDDYSRLVEGKLQISKEQDIIMLNWENQNPEWTKGNQFQTTIQINSSGYKMSSIRLQ